MAIEREIKHFALKSIQKVIAKEIDEWEAAYIQGDFLIVRKGTTEYLFPMSNVDYLKIALVDRPEPQEAARPFKKAETKEEEADEDDGQSTE